MLVLAGVVMGVCAIVILTKSPEALAALAVAAIILGANYALPFSDWNRTVDTETLNIEMRDGQAYITNSVAPEYVAISSELWNQLETYDPVVDADSGLEPPAMWLEAIAHADEDKDNAGYAVHITASNVMCVYRVSQAPDGDGYVIATLGSWSEL